MARYLFASQNKITESRRRKELEKKTYLTPRRRRPSQPTWPRGSAVFLAPGRLLPPWRACRRCLAAQATPVPYLLATPLSGDVSLILPSPALSSPPLFFDFVDVRKPPERAAVADVATAP